MSVNHPDDLPVTRSKLDGRNRGRTFEAWKTGRLHLGIVCETEKLKKSGRLAASGKNAGIDRSVFIRTAQTNCHQELAIPRDLTIQS